MKKYFLLVLLIVPFTASAAPSVRVLGNKNAVVTPQVVPAKIDTVKSNINNARTGTVKARVSGISGPSGILTSSGSRFPVISPVKSYNMIKQPSVSESNSGNTNPGNSGTNTGSCNMCTDTINEIVDTAVNRVEGDVLKNYYDKTEVYNNNNFIEGVKDAAEEIDDPRIDAIRTRDPSNLHRNALPNDYVYIWIEQ